MALQIMLLRLCAGSLLCVSFYYTLNGLTFYICITVRFLSFLYLYQCLKVSVSLVECFMHGVKAQMY